MYDTLVMEVYEAFEDLPDVYTHEILGELAKTLAYVVQRSIFAESAKGSIKSG